MRCGSSRQSSVDPPGCWSHSWQIHPGGGADTVLGAFTINTMFSLSRQCKVDTLTAVVTLVRYRSWFPPFVAVGRAMVRCSGLTGKIPVETFYSRMFLSTYFPNRQFWWFIVKGIVFSPTLMVKLNSGPMSSSVLTAVTTGVAASAT